MNQKGFSNIIIIVLVVVLVIIGGFLVLSKKSNLQTYKNDKYGFEFKYPKDFTVSERQMVDNDGDPITRVELKLSSDGYEIGVTLLKAGTAAINLETEKKELEKYKSRNHYGEVDAGIFSGYQSQAELSYSDGKKVGVVYQLLNKQNKSQWLRVEIISTSNTILPVAEKQAINIISTFIFTR